MVTHLKPTACLLNHVASKHCHNQVSLNALTGVTQDLSAALFFHWCEKVYCQVDGTFFPSEIAGASGHYWVF